MITDPIANMLVQLKNAGLARRPQTSVPASNLKLAIAEKLKQAGYLKSVTKRGKKVKKDLDLELLYTASGEPKIAGLERVSRPSARVYHDRRQIRSVRQGHGLAIYSTPRGLLTDREAREQKIGGEILFKIW